jgi:HD-GYP domain-containing protein (c-di-GMP phosphodiesterase class II)
VVDVFDALMSTRPYKGPWSVEQATAEIAAGSGSHFEPAIAEAFLAICRRGGVDDLIGAAAADSAPAGPD